MIETTKLNNRLFEIEQMRMALRRIRNILNDMKADVEAELYDIHNSPEYQESIKKQLLGED